MSNFKYDFSHEIIKDSYDLIIKEDVIVDAPKISDKINNFSDTNVTNITLSENKLIEYLNIEIPKSNNKIDQLFDFSLSLDDRLKILNELPLENIIDITSRLKTMYSFTNMNVLFLFLIECIYKTNLPFDIKMDFAMYIYESNCESNCKTSCSKKCEEKCNENRKKNRKKEKENETIKTSIKALQYCCELALNNPEYFYSKECLIEHIFFLLNNSKDNLNEILLHQFITSLTIDDVFKIKTMNNILKIVKKNSENIFINCTLKYLYFDKSLKSYQFIYDKQFDLNCDLFLFLNSNLKSYQVVMCRNLLNLNNSNSVIQIIPLLYCIMIDKSLSENIRADACDCIMTYSNNFGENCDKIKMISTDILKKLGNQKYSIYDNSQNVHNENISKSVMKIINNLKTTIEIKEKFHEKS